MNFQIRNSPKNINKIERTNVYIKKQEICISLYLILKTILEKFSNAKQNGFFFIIKRKKNAHKFVAIKIKTEENDTEWRRTADAKRFTFIVISNNSYVHAWQRTFFWIIFIYVQCLTSCNVLSYRIHSRACMHPVEHAFMMKSMES